jgi:hypothetical protein
MQYNCTVFDFVLLFIITPDSRAYRDNSCMATFIDIAPAMLAASGILYKCHYYFIISALCLRRAKMMVGFCEPAYGEPVESIKVRHAAPGFFVVVFLTVLKTQSRWKIKSFFQSQDQGARAGCKLFILYIFSFLQ